MLAVSNERNLDCALIVFNSQMISAYSVLKKRRKLKKNCLYYCFNSSSKKYIYYNYSILRNKSMSSYKL